MQNIKDINIVDINYRRYCDVKSRGHDSYITVAKLNEDFYSGGGKQWRGDDREYLESLDRPVIEDNQIFPAVNTAKGMQVKNRVDISFKPSSNNASEETAHTLTQIAMQICDDINYQWLESQVYEDGLIQQRGYFDVRISFDDNMMGSITATDVDPLDVMPDPNANSYNPDTWADVTVSKHLTLDDIEQLYGKSKRNEVESFSPIESNGDTSEDRNSFATTTHHTMRATRPLSRLTSILLSTDSTKNL